MSCCNEENEGSNSDSLILWRVEKTKVDFYYMKKNFIILGYRLIFPDEKTVKLEYVKKKVVDICSFHHPPCGENGRSSAGQSTSSLQRLVLHHGETSSGAVFTKLVSC